MDVQASQLGACYVFHQVVAFASDNNPLSALNTFYQGWVRLTHEKKLKFVNRKNPVFNLGFNADPPSRPFLRSCSFSVSVTWRKQIKRNKF